MKLPIMLNVALRCDLIKDLQMDYSGLFSYSLSAMAGEGLSV